MNIERCETMPIDINTENITCHYLTDPSSWCRNENICCFYLNKSLSKSILEKGKQHTCDSIQFFNHISDAGFGISKEKKWEKNFFK